MALSADAWYIGLLGLAESFRTSSPPDIRGCVRCLQAVFAFRPPARVEARTHLQLGNILLNHTTNTHLAKDHLERSVVNVNAPKPLTHPPPPTHSLIHSFSHSLTHPLTHLQWMLSQSIPNGFDDVKFEAASVLAELYEQQAQSTLSKPILRKAIELSQHNVYWHCRLIFQLAVSLRNPWNPTFGPSFAFARSFRFCSQQIHATEKDYEIASSLLGVGVDYAHISNANYTRVLFLLSRGMVISNRLIFHSSVVISPINRSRFSFAATTHRQKDPGGVALAEPSGPLGRLVER